MHANNPDTDYLVYVGLNPNQASNRSAKQYALWFLTAKRWAFLAVSIIGWL